MVHAIVILKTGTFIEPELNDKNLDGWKYSFIEVNPQLKIN